MHSGRKKYWKCLRELRYKCYSKNKECVSLILFYVIGKPVEGTGSMIMESAMAAGDPLRVIPSIQIRKGVFRIPE